MFYSNGVAVVKLFLTNSKVFGDGEELKEGPLAGIRTKFQTSSVQTLSTTLRKHSDTTEGR